MFITTHKFIYYIDYFNSFLEPWVLVGSVAFWGFIGSKVPDMEEHAMKRINYRREQLGLPPVLRSQINTQVLLETKKE